jgi:hypothetical protein
MSASDIANNKNRQIYDIFALPYSSNSFVPNTRLQTLLQMYELLLNETNDQNIDVLSCEHYLRANLKSLHTWKYSTGGSETKICDPNLLKYLTLINRRINRHNNDSIVIKDALPFRLVLAKVSTKSEHRIQCNNHVLIGSEAKGVEHSQYEASIQGLQLGGDGAVEMWRCGLSTELAVVPVILSYSDCLHVHAVYLMPACYPVLVQLSPPMTILTFEGRLAISRWGIVLAKFALETIELLKQVRGRPDRPQQLGLYISESLFFKPLRQYHKLDSREESSVDSGSSLRTNLDSVMFAYHRIYPQENACEYFLFPLGVVSYPSTTSTAYASICSTLHETMCSKMKRCISTHFPHYHEDLVADGCPVIVYDMLPMEEWVNTKPPPELVQSYVRCVTIAVDIMNAAKIAHMDLRPANIMWCRLSMDITEVKIRVIDLEDAVPFGFCIRSVESLKLDPRYPIFRTDDRTFIPASSAHNDWFCEAVSSWAQQDDENEFTQYMASNYSMFIRN